MHGDKCQFAHGTEDLKGSNKVNLYLMNKMGGMDSYNSNNNFNNNMNNNMHMMNKTKKTPNPQNFKIVKCVNFETCKNK